MTRQIKFRAWDKVNKRFGYLDHPFDNNWYEHPTTYGTCPAVFTNNWRDKIADNYEIMQYTGVQDSKGRDIYDGDIVLLSRTNPVTFLIESYLQPRKGYAFRWIYTDTKKEAGGYFLDNCEVIGNRYENPELLK